MSKTNGEFEVGTTILETAILGPGAFSESVGGGVLGPTAYFSITAFALIEHTTEAITTFDLFVGTVPEPASPGLLGRGLFGLGRAGRKTKSIWPATMLVTTRTSDRQQTFPMAPGKCFVIPTSTDRCVFTSVEGYGCQ